jgi:recombination protein RecR
MADIIEQLTESLRCLPGVGPKTAQRLVYYFLKNNRKQALLLAKNLDEAMNNVVQCSVCNNFCTSSVCTICQNPNRNRNQLCIVEQPSDVFAIEQSRTYQGYYFILTAKISPIDGIGIEDLGLEKLKSYLNAHQLEEVIIALPPSVETQATLYYIQQLLSPFTSIRLTQLAQGVPSGTDLQSLDPLTISTAMRHRNIVQD